MTSLNLTLMVTSVDNYPVILTPTPVFIPGLTLMFYDSIFFFFLIHVTFTQSSRVQHIIKCVMMQCLLYVSQNDIGEAGAVLLTKMLFIT